MGKNKKDAKFGHHYQYPGKGIKIRENHADQINGNFQQHKLSHHKRNCRCHLCQVVLRFWKQYPAAKNVNRNDDQWKKTSIIIDQLFEYKHFYKNDCYYEVKHSPKATPKIYSPVKCFNPEFNLAVGFFGCSENELPELDKIIITSIGNENFYYHWNGMPFVSKKYMIQNQEDLKLGVARIASNYDGQHVIHDKKDQIVNLEKWFEQYCQETAQAA